MLELVWPLQLPGDLLSTPRPRPRSGSARSRGCEAEEQASLAHTGAPSVCAMLRWLRAALGPLPRPSLVGAFPPSQPRVLNPAVTVQGVGIAESCRIHDRASSGGRWRSRPRCSRKPSALKPPNTAPRTGSICNGRASPASRFWVGGLGTEPTIPTSPSVSFCMQERERSKGKRGKRRDGAQ